VENPDKAEEKREKEKNKIEPRKKVIRKFPEGRGGGGGKKKSQVKWKKKRKPKKMKGYALWKGAVGC